MQDLSEASVGVNAGYTVPSAGYSTNKDSGAHSDMPSDDHGLLRCVHAAGVIALLRALGRTRRNRTSSTRPSHIIFMMR